MAKTRTIDRRQRQKSHRKKPSIDRRSPRELLDKAGSLLQEAQPEQALPLALNALSQLEAIAQSDPNDLIPALVILGEINLELGEVDSSRQFFLRAASLDPEGEIASAEPALWLAQLSEEGGYDSIRWYQKAIEILTDEIKYLEGLGSEDVEARNVIVERKLRMSEALCSMVETYMTDLSLENEAETRCEEHVTEALLLAPESPTVLQTLASIRISQTRPEEARLALQRSMDVWNDLPPDDPAVPDFATRISLSRLLMEVDMEHKAMPVIERLLVEDDQSVEACYLGGWCHYLQAKKGADTKSLAAEWLHHALRLYRSLAYEDERLRLHAVELVDELDNELGRTLDHREGEEGSDDGDWEDSDDMEISEDGVFEGFPEADGDGHE